MITQEELQHMLRYYPSTGKFVWRNPSAYRPECKGKVAGSADANGYIQISIKRMGYKAHRLAWLYVHGTWPDGYIDHINGDRSDNRIKNLRVVSASGNAENRRTARSGHAVGLLGVVWRPRTRKYEARINVNKQYVYLGLFDSAEAAHAAYRQAKRKYHKCGTL